MQICKYVQRIVPPFPPPPILKRGCEYCQAVYTRRAKFWYPLVELCELFNRKVDRLGSVFSVGEQPLLIILRVKAVYTYILCKYKMCAQIRACIHIRYVSTVSLYHSFVYAKCLFYSAPPPPFCILMLHASTSATALQPKFFASITLEYSTIKDCYKPVFSPLFFH